MVQLNAAVLLSVLASTALAAPKHRHSHTHRHGHGPRPTAGTGAPYPYPVPTGGAYPAGNGTYGGPTGSGTGVTTLDVTSTQIIYSTVYVSPIPASPSAQPAASSLAVVDQQVGTGAADTCGPATVTVTSQQTLTVTVPAAGSVGGVPAAYSPSSSVVGVPVGYSASNSVVSTPAAYSPPSSAPAVYTPDVSTPATSAVPSTTEAAIVPSSVYVSAPAAISSPSSSGGGEFIQLPPSTAAAYSTPAASPVSTPAPASPTPSPTTPESGSGSSGGKRGLVYNTASLCAPFAQNTDISWAYNWGSSSGGLSGFEFVPMLWGSDTSNFKSNVDQALASGSKYIMGFNEPDMLSGADGGSDINPGEAATLYKNNIAPYASKAKLVSPAVTNGNTSTGITGGPMGVVWLDAWKKACGNDCPVDAIALHWYGWDAGTAEAQASALMTYISDAKTDIKKIFGREIPIWLTEFSAKPFTNQAVLAEFMSIVLPQLDSPTSGVERYSAFMDSEGIMVTGSRLTPMGAAYAKIY